MLPYTIIQQCAASAGPRDAAFTRTRTPSTKAARGTPTFFWENYGHWCFAGFKDVNALLRDKRFGRQILHLVTPRAARHGAEPKAHTAAFDQTEKYSLLTLEPPAHTRLRTLVNRAFVSRNVEQLRPRIERLANELIDGFEADGEVELLQGLRRADPGDRHRRDDRRCRPRWRCNCSIGPTAWSPCTCSASPTRPNSTPTRRRPTSWTICAAMIAERRRQPREDLLTHMLTAEIDGQKLTEDEVISTAILLLNAGHEATVHTTGNGVQGDPRERPRPEGAVRDDDADRGDGRGVPALRRAAPHVHPLRAEDVSSRTASASSRARRSA